MKQKQQAQYRTRNFLGNFLKPLNLLQLEMY